MPSKSKLHDGRRFPYWEHGQPRVPTSGTADENHLCPCIPEPGVYAMPTPLSPQREFNLCVTTEGYTTRKSKLSISELSALARWVCGIQRGLQSKEFLNWVE